MKKFNFLLFFVLAVLSLQTVCAEERVDSLSPEKKQAYIEVAKKVISEFAPEVNIEGMKVLVWGPMMTKTVRSKAGERPAIVEVPEIAVCFGNDIKIFRNESYSPETGFGPVKERPSADYTVIVSADTMEPRGMLAGYEGVGFSPDYKTCIKEGKRLSDFVEVK